MTTLYQRVVAAVLTVALTTTSVRRPAGSGRSAIAAARMTRTPATILRASSVRAKSGRMACRSRSHGVGSSESPTTGT